MVLRAGILKMVGAEGFEPPTLWSQTKCASQAALCPDIIKNIKATTEIIVTSSIT